MKLERDEWARVLGHLDTALDLPAPEREPWLAALALEPPRLKAALRQLLADRAAIETGDFLSAGAEASLLHEGQRLGPWRLLRELGQGGMATVWLAERHDGAHRRPVALKLPRRVFGSRVIAERFLREREILSTLQHPHIAQVLDAGEAQGQPWLALEFVAGRPITEHAQAQGLDLRARLRLFGPVLQAVQHAHGQLVIHRDLKPANVLVSDEGVVKLLDFGVAKLLEPGGDGPETALTQLGGRALTPQYASPEQLAGRPLGVASDVYALGVLLYELLTGRLPYRVQRDSAAALEEAILQAQVLRPSQAVADARLARALRGDVDTIVMKALEPEPARRYASAAEMAQDIERHLQLLPIAARPAGPALRLRKLWARRRLALGAGFAVALALAGGAGLALWQAGQARAEARRAEAVQRFLVDIFKANAARQPDPEKARAATARELLDIGAERIDHELADQPAARQALLGTLAQMYKDLGLEQRAAELQRQAVALALARSGRDSAEHLLQLARLANVLADAAVDAERRRVVDEGLAVLARRPDRPAPERVAMWLEAASLYQSARLADAEALGQRALADARALGDPDLLRRAHEMAGVTAQLRGDDALAEQRLAEAVRIGQQAGLASYELLRARAQLADVQARLLKLDASEATLRAALADSLRTSGPAHINTHQTRLRLAFALARQGRLHDALAEHEALQAALQAAPTLDSFSFPLHATAYGQTLTRMGRLVEAERVLRQGIEVRDRTRPGTRVAAELREFLVHPLVAQGRVAEAEALRAEAAAIRAAAGLKPGQRTWAQQAVAALALARARGDAAGARAALATLVAGSEADPPNSLGWIDGTLVRASFEVEQGELDAALARLQRLRGVLAEHGLAGRIVPVEGQRLTLCAAIAARRGAAAQAAEDFERARQLYARELDEAAPLRREWAALRQVAPGARASSAPVDCR